MVKKGWWKSRLFPNKNWQVGSPALWNCKIRYIILVFQQQKWGISGQWVLLEHTPGNCYSRLYLSCRYQACALNHGILGICFMKSLDQQQKYFWNVIVLQGKVNWAWKSKLQEGTLISFVVLWLVRVSCSVLWLVIAQLTFWNISSLHGFADETVTVKWIFPVDSYFKYKVIELCRHLR